MSKIEHLCRNRGTMEMCHIMRRAIDNDLLKNSKHHATLETIMTECDDIELFQWISNQSIVPEQYKETIKLIQEYQSLV